MDPHFLAMTRNSLLEQVHTIDIDRKYKDEQVCVYVREKGKGGGQMNDGKMELKCRKKGKFKREREFLPERERERERVKLWRSGREKIMKTV